MEYVQQKLVEMRDARSDDACEKMAGEGQRVDVAGLEQAVARAVACTR